MYLSNMSSGHKHTFDNYILFCFYIIEAQIIEMLQNASSTILIYAPDIN